MDDGVEVGERGGVVEDPVGDRGTVEGAVGGDDLAPEALDHGVEDGGPRLLQLADDGAGVDHDRAALGQHGRHGGLARADASGETDDQHGVRR